MCLRKVEKIQRLATKWFFGVNVDYKTRLIKCGLLPLSMYIELHDVLFMRDLLKNKYDYTTTNEMNLKESKRTRQDARNELEIPKVNRNKCSENFFHRTTKLVNILSRKLGSLEDLNKPKLSYLYRNFFLEQYNELNTCSWRILCSCGSCNPHSKLWNCIFLFQGNELMNWRVKTLGCAPKSRLHYLGIIQKSQLLLLLLLWLLILVRHQNRPTGHWEITEKLKMDIASRG